MTPSVAELVRRGVLSPIDGHFAALLGRLAPSSPPEVLLAAALASRAVQRGHVCADLEVLGGKPLLAEDDEPAPVAVIPPASVLRDALRSSPLVASSPDDDAPRPLVLAPSGKLYLYRYARYERALVEALRARAAVTERVDGPALRSGLDLLFGGEGASNDEQRRAALVAAMSRIAVVSGGPGTGKTYTVSRILALLLMQARALGKPPLRILLLAPTGKAAQRVGESIEKSVRDLPCDAPIRDSVPRKAATIHRALGYQPRTPTTYRHHRDNPLPADVVLVDEASMIDVALMAKLVLAVPEDARLVLLGDRDQLSSVEAGAILGDMYGDGAHPGYSPAFAKAVRGATGDELPVAPSAVPAIADRLVHFTRSRRFGDESDVGRLSRAIRDGDADGALAVLQNPGGAARIHPLDSARRLEPMLGSFVGPAYSGLVRGSPAERLAELGRFRILCAHRKGPFGVEAVNAFVERHLEARDRRDRSSPWYDGRPVMITANDYQLELWNGDLGVLARGPEDGAVAAHFPGTDAGPLRTLPPTRLPAHETVYAMTVHKSQGSQMEHVVLLLPEELSPLLTRELVYTAVSRAEARVDIFAPEAVLRETLSRTVERASGLREALWSR
ncbi:MAG TPA: exodeoxyribonuclease V subunit alpha [Polyangiaceae bacterium]|nr:exodeoxyribonuclease V subunit alpha [Polyangiaceae bacterium]